MKWWSKFRSLRPQTQVIIWGVIGVLVVGGIGSATKRSESQRLVTAEGQTGEPSSQATDARGSQPGAPSASTEKAAQASAPATEATEAEETTALPPPPTAGPEDVARCNDGTYSDNTDFSATCSAHDDVDVWLADYGRCDDGTVIEMDEDSSCDGHGAFDELMPTDYTPPPPTTEPPPTTLPPAVALSVNLM